MSLRNEVSNCLGLTQLGLTNKRYMTTNFTQYHHWGVIEHGIKTQIWHQYVSDEYLWEFMTPEEILENTFGLEVIHNFIALGGGFELMDKPDPLPRFHDLTLWAYHPDPRRLTWISLQKL